MSKVMVRPLALLATAGLLLSACHKKPPEPQNATMELPAAEPAPAPPPPLPEAKPKVEKPVTPPADHAQISDEEQMREDAEATGMTSRVANNGDSAAPASGDNSSGH